MDEIKKFLLFLSQFDFSSAKIQKIIDVLEPNISLENFCKTKFDEKVISSSSYLKMIDNAESQRIDNFYDNLLNQDVFFITKYDEEYPAKLKYFEDAPFYLFCKGDKSLLNSQSVAMVGTRKPSAYGRAVTEKFAREIASASITIISGLAYGVDSISHRKCLEVGGKTIAVLGSGFNKIYPTEHISLAQEIAEKGLLVSEYCPNTTATKYTFPQRNRIIAGLSDGVIITEAGLKSGTIHTKDFALEYGKAIYAVPGEITSESSSLTNDIIKSGQANLVTCAKDILDDFVLEKNENLSSKKQIVQLSIEEQQIVSLLSDGIKDIDFLTKNCNLAINVFNGLLTTLELRGIISRLPGGMISLN